MPLTQGHNKKYTYAEYLTWQDDERWELIDGEAYDMTPAPTTTHQRIAARFYSRLEAALNAKPCTPFIAPTDVVLSQHDVVQPDVLVVWDERQITRENIRGNPDLIVGVLSPATVRKDRREKKALYEKFALKEYISIEPDGQVVERFWLEPDGTFSKGEIFSPSRIASASCTRRGGDPSVGSVPGEKNWVVGSIGSWGRRVHRVIGSIGSLSLLGLSGLLSLVGRWVGR